MIDPAIAQLLQPILAMAPPETLKAMALEYLPKILNGASDYADNHYRDEYGDPAEMGFAFMPFKGELTDETVILRVLDFDVNGELQEPLTFGQIKDFINGFDPSHITKQIAGA